MKKIISGNIRISLLSENLLRIEERGHHGFEDRPTFLVMDRNWPEIHIEKCRRKNTLHIKTALYKVTIPEGCKNIKEVKIFDREGKKLLWEGEIPDRTTLPRENEKGDVYVLPDSRVIPPPWGGLPPPSGDCSLTSGWELDNDSVDIYIFVYNGDLRIFRRDFLKLTGKIPIPPLWSFGFWHSLYHPYRDKEALETIKKYREEGIPLDVFVVDTDWRVGGSTGYDIEKKYFPDMEKFFREAHDLNVKVVMNDHPGPRGMKPVEPEMLKYRYENLTSFLSWGLDTWWYDKNWYEYIEGPHTTIPREVWGQYLYWHIISHKRPGMRTFLLSMWSDHAASHRYPLWWTGDIHSTWDNLRDAIRDTLWFGEQCMPYVGQDLGGHIGDPDDELYVRFLQYGCLSPTARVHGSIGTKRYPWLYSKEAQKIVTEYIKLRYRLLPTIYSAARKAWEDGTPLLKHPYTIWPEYEKAKNYIEYILGEDLLVAPVYTQKGFERLDCKYLSYDGEKGIKGEYFPNPDLAGEPFQVKRDREISFPSWAGEPLETGGEGFSIRWSGKIRLPERGLYTFRTISSDGVRLWVEGKLLIDNWKSHRECYDTADIELEGGTDVPIKLEFYNRRGFWIIRLDWTTPGSRHKTPAHRLWIPPGEWQCLWTGEVYRGPKEIEVETPLSKTPIFARRGGIIMLSPEMNYTGEKPWKPVILEIFPTRKGSVKRTLYEDDGLTLEYQKGGYRKTVIEASWERGMVSVKIGEPEGYFRGAPSKRDWIVRVHLKNGEMPGEIFINSKKIEKENFSVINPERRENFEMPLKGKGAKPAEKAGPVVEIPLISDRFTKTFLRPQRGFLHLFLKFP